MSLNAPGKTIKLYWWRDGEMINLGDEIGRHIVEFASGRPVERASGAVADMLSVGSILSFPQPDPRTRLSPYLVWGSGTLTNSGRSRQELFSFSAVRGPLTFSLLNRHEPLPFGDPGILISAMWPHDGSKRHRWGLIPHFSQLNRPWVSRVLEKTPGAILIDVRDPDVESNCRLIASCEFIASSSLHGLILADSYGVPNLWLTEGGVNNTWKFWDYFSGINRKAVAAVGVGNLSELTPHEADLNIQHFADLPVKMNRLLAAFPV